MYKRQKPKGETNSSFLVLHASSAVHTVKAVGSRLNINLICINFVGLPWQRAINNLQKTSVSKNNGLQRLFTYYFNYVSNNSNKKKGIRARNKLFPRYCFLIDRVRTHESISSSPRFLTKTFATVMNTSRNT